MYQCYNAWQQVPVLCSVQTWNYFFSISDFILNISFCFNTYFYFPLSSILHSNFFFILVPFEFSKKKTSFFYASLPVFFQFNIAVHQKKHFAVSVVLGERQQFCHTHTTQYGGSGASDKVRRDVEWRDEKTSIWGHRRWVEKSRPPLSFTLLKKTRKSDDSENEMCHEEAEKWEQQRSTNSEGVLLS